MIIPLEDRWGLLSVLEQEHGAREALRRLHADGDLIFETTDPKDQQTFLETAAPRYVSQSLKQSKEFFRQAETSSWLVKPLLLYYGMLTCAKACLVFGIPDFMKSRAARTHGVSSENAFRDKINIDSENLTVRVSGVYPLLRRILGLKPFPADTVIPIPNLLVRVPEVDSWYRLLFSKGASGQDWFAITGSIMLQDQSGVRIGFDLVPDFYKTIEKRIPETITAAFDMSAFKDSNGQERIGFTGKSVWPTQEAATSIGVPPVMTPNGNTSCNVILPLECNGVLYDISEVELIFLLMFYLSSIARYQPHLWLQMHAGTEDFSILLTQTLLNTCENHFLGLVWARLYYTMSLPLVKRP